MLHHKLKFAVERSLFDQMFDVLQNLHHEVIYFLIGVEVDWVVDVVVFVHEELFLPLEIDHL